jgi:hypothetical protein
MFMQRAMVSAKEIPAAAAAATSCSLLLNRSAGLLQRKCACGGMPEPTGECEECHKKRLQRRTTQHSTLNSQPADVPPIVHDVLRSPGRPLDAATRSFMERRFGHDFSSVRIHRGPEANSAAEAAHAAAFTVGRDVVFADSFYQPDTSSGRFLLAHELAHTIQQKTASGAQTFKLGPANDASEVEADAIAQKVIAPSASAAPARFGLISTGLSLAKIDCSKLKYGACKAGVYKCGFGNTGTCAWVGPSRGGCICVGELGPKDILIPLAILGLIAVLIASIPADIILSIGVALAAIARWLAFLFGLAGGAAVATAAESERGGATSGEPAVASGHDVLPTAPDRAPTPAPARPQTSPPAAEPQTSHAPAPTTHRKASGTKHPPLKKASGGHTYHLSVIEGLNLDRVSVGKSYAITFDPKGPRQKFIVLQVTKKTAKEGDTTVEFISLLECSRADKECETGGNFYIVTHPYRPSQVRAETGRVLSEK